MPTSSEEAILGAAKSLQTRGARNVLVTLGDKGSLIVCHDGTLLQQPCFPLPGGKVLCV